MGWLVYTAVGNIVNSNFLLIVIGGSINRARAEAVLFNCRNQHASRTADRHVLNCSVLDKV